MSAVGVSWDVATPPVALEGYVLTTRDEVAGGMMTRGFRVAIGMKGGENECYRI